MTPTVPRPVFRRPVLVLIACVLAALTMVGLRSPAARADDAVCATGPYTIVASGPDGSDLTQPPMALIGLRVYTATGDPLASVCNGTPLTFDWTYQDYFTGSGPQVTVAGTSDQETVTYLVRVSVGSVLIGTGQVTLSYVDVAPTITSLTTSPTAPSAGQPTTLTAATDSPSIRSSAWDFGDGGTASGNGTSIDHVYRAPGDYTVSVVGTDWFGKTGSATQVIHVSAPLLGGFTLSPSTAGVGETVHVDGSNASTDPGATITGYTWDFGDGTHATGPTADYAYAATGTYTVTETVTDSIGRSTSATRDVVVQATPVDPPGPTGTPVAAWTTTTPIPTAASPTSFDGTASTDDGSITGYAWTFGDGASGAGATPRHTYSSSGRYPVTLTVTDDSGLTNSVTHLVSVADAAPTAAFSSAPAAPTTATPTSFDGTGSHDPDGTVAHYAWDFGDDSTGSGATPAHTYAAAGDYPVVLTVTDDEGVSDSVTHTVAVAVAPVPDGGLPTAAFTMGSSSMIAGSALAFDAGPSSDSGGTLTGYSWTFGDGSTGTGAAPQHTYAAPGTYPVTLTVTDSRGKTASASRSLAVHWGSADLAVSVAGSAPKAGLYTYRVTVRNLGSTAAHGIVLLATPDSTQVLASPASAPAGVPCAGVKVGATGTLTCKANAATALAAGKAWTVTFTVKQPSTPRGRLVTETSQVKAANPDPITANNTARLGTPVAAKL